MSEVKKQKVLPKLRVGLLIIQILLPFGLYLAMISEDRILAVIIAVLIGLSMVLLTVLK